MTSKEALQRLQLDDVVGGMESASRSADLTRRSSGQSSAVSGRAQGGPPPAPPKVLAPPVSMEASGLHGAGLLESGELEDLEITPNVNRADTLPEWLMESGASAAELPTRPPVSRMAQNRRSGWRTAGVMMLALVAAGTWWFAADGVKALSPAAPAVVAAAPVVAPAPVAEAPPAPMVVETRNAAAVPSVMPKSEVAPTPVPKKVRAQRARAQAAKNSKARPKRKARTSAKPAPVAPPNVELGAVSGLMVGAAGSGRSCRSVGALIAASEHERVNVCFKVRPVGSLSGVVVQWRHDGKVVRSTEHDLPSSDGPHSIRAFARVQSAKSGPWSVQVRTRGGKVLASKKFSVGM